MSDFDFTESTQRLKQVCIEDLYSRSNIYKQIKIAITGTATSLSTVFNHCVTAVDMYKSTPATYTSKQARISAIQGIDTEQLVLAIWIAVLPCNTPTSIQLVATKVAKELELLSVFDAITTAAELITMCYSSGIFILTTDPILITSAFTFSKEMQDKIDQAQFLMPMLCPPDDWTTNMDGGYLSIKHNVLLGKMNKHAYLQGLDVLNVLQSIEWELDMDVLNTPEVSNKPLDTQEKVDAWAKYTWDSAKAYNYILDADNSFWLMWRYDFRGRAYSHGYHVNLQSNSFNKALFNFKHKQIMT